MERDLSLRTPELDTLVDKLRRNASYWVGQQVGRDRTKPLRVGEVVDLELLLTDAADTVEALATSEPVRAEWERHAQTVWDAANALPSSSPQDDLSRQSSPCPTCGTGSPRSPQLEGSVLSALRQRLEPVARREHDRAVAANALFSVEHWKHNAGPEWPHEPDDDSFTAFENCRHPLCVAVRPDVPLQVEPARIGAFDYTENADGTITRKDWRQP